MKTIWKSLVCPAIELNLNVTLSCGQSFRWKKIRENEWIGVLKGNVWTLTQNEDQLLYNVKGNDELKVEECEETLKEYFQLKVHLDEKYKQWSKADKHFKKVAPLFPGVRILRQDPVETLFCFICSSNNNIPRITSMVEKLCEKYGECIYEIEGQNYYSFPSVEALAASGVEEELRKLSFGYRAKYISQTAKYIWSQEDKQEWLYKLRYASYETAFLELQKLSGVGAKVADCICLMALDKHDAIPVDTHVYQIARENYLPDLKKKKSLTSAVYKEVGDCFRDIFGGYAGWAHSVLFSADLKKFLNTQKC